MGKYLYAYALSLQNVLQRRSSLVMDRVGGLAIVTALYFFWASLLGGREDFLGYTRAQLLSYALAMNVLRSFVFTGRGWELVGEIASGRISSYLLRPIDYVSYSLSLDLAQKTVHAAAALLEVGALIYVLDAPVYIPRHAVTWALFLLALAISSLLFFLLEFLVSALAFWTSESAGPLFCFEIFVQFASGSFFPIDVLPGGLQALLRATPFPYIVFFPLNIYLERATAAEALRLLALQGAWLALAWALTRIVWNRGLREYAAEGG